MVAISSFIILPTGMPVQPEITSPTICASTQTRIRPASPCRPESSVSNAESWARNSEGLGSTSGDAAAATAAAVPGADAPAAVAGSESLMAAEAPASRCRRGCPRIVPPSSLVRMSRILETRSRSFSHRSRRVASRASTSDFLLRKVSQSFLVIDADGSLALQNALLHFQVVDLPNGVFDRRRSRTLAQGQPGACRVQNANCLVG